MKLSRLMCFFGSHDWTAWRRPPTKPPVGPVIKTVAQFQHRRCKRCGRKESRGIPIIFTMPDNVSAVKLTMDGGGGPGGKGPQ